VVRFQNLAIPVIVAINDSKEIVWVAPDRFEQFKLRQYKPTRRDIEAWAWARKHHLRPLP
jgi:hypothetical protein